MFYRSGSIWKHAHQNFPSKIPATRKQAMQEDPQGKINSKNKEGGKRKRRKRRKVKKTKRRELGKYFLLFFINFILYNN